MAGQDVALELFLVGVPELGCLGVQRARAVLIVSIDRMRVPGILILLTCWARPVDFASSTERFARCRRRSICP